ncbi:hypothetical protein [Thioalkalivibrio denitrificans]|uniref:hypothetical protein n=1 Tax=Thioalkalivibrio denitrificans TaxID=108003 RepID=UPI00158CFB83|nr:hypothetical protein [Thioalkalivibrio denitrificans]
MNKLIVLGHKGQAGSDLHPTRFDPRRIVNRACNTEGNVGGEVLQLLSAESRLDEFESYLLDDFADEELLELIELIGIGLESHFDFPEVFLSFDVISSRAATVPCD